MVRVQSTGITARRQLVLFKARVQRFAHDNVDNQEIKTTETLKQFRVTIIIDSRLRFFFRSVKEFLSSRDLLCHPISTDVAFL